MSKIAQQKALEAYPEIRLYEPNYDENVWHIIFNKK